MELIEFAPGIDIDRDILAQMDFAPLVRDPTPMDARLFRPEPMGLREDLLELPLEQRFSYRSGAQSILCELRGLLVPHFGPGAGDRTDRSRRRRATLPGKVYAIVNYDNFSISPDVLDAYVDMVKRLVERHYSGVTRYTTSGFLRMKLGDALASRDVAPHIYESPEEARAHLGRLEAGV